MAARAHGGVIDATSIVAGTDHYQDVDETDWPCSHSTTMGSSDHPDHAPRILVAEDDELLRALIVDALTEAGFEVTEADHGEEALRLLCSHPESFDALFTDINMPGLMDGIELARRARHELPRLGVVIGSGGCRPPPSALPSRSRFLPKPYHVSDISDYVRESITPT